MAVKSKQKQSDSQTTPTPRHTPPSPKTEEPQPSAEKAKKAKSAPASRESAAEQNLQAMERMKRFSKMYPTADVWGTEMTNLDAEIPYDLRPMIRSLAAKPVFAPAKLSDLWYAIKHNATNWMKNSYSMFVMAKANAFPGKNIQLRVRTLTRIWNVRNSSSDALLAPLRQIALDTYQKTNRSIARGHEDGVRAFTSGPFREKTIGGLRRRGSSSSKDRTWSWSIASDVSDAALFPSSKSARTAPTPVDILSLRAGEVYTETAEPVDGHRLLIQALVRFDTTQRTEGREKRGGRAVDSDLAGTRRVVQYLLLEKVGWYDAPWKIKEQCYKP